MTFSTTVAAGNKVFLINENDSSKYAVSSGYCITIMEPKSYRPIHTSIHPGDGSEEDLDNQSVRVSFLEIS